MIKKLIISMILFIVSIYFILTLYFDDVQINKYPDKVVVVEQKAIERGWVPAILPETAYEISETHDTDTNDIFGAFFYKEKEEADFIQKLELLPDTNQTYVWEDFLFKIDKEQNRVKFRNKPAS